MKVDKTGGEDRKMRNEKRRILGNIKEEGRVENTV